MQKVLISMEIPALSAHLTDTKIMCSDNKYYEFCGKMGRLIGLSGIDKAQKITSPVGKKYFPN